MAKVWQLFCECAKNVCLSSNMRQINLLYATTTTDQRLYEVLSENSQARSKKKCWLNLLKFGCHPLQNSLLGNSYSDPIFFSRFTRAVEVIFLTAVEYRLRFPLDDGHCFRMSSLPFHFQFGKQRNHRGLSPASREDGER
jgi:hypothetical protein